MQCEGSAVFEGVFALDPQHVWAVGGIKVDSIWYLAVYFYDGNSWGEQWRGGYNNNLVAVHGCDRTHVWAKSLDGRIYFFDGNSWVEQCEGDLNGYGGIYALAENDVWVVGSGWAYHYDGESWKGEHVGENLSLLDVRSFDSGHVLAVGKVQPEGHSEQSVATVFHREDGSWGQENIGSPGYNRFEGIAATDENYIWAVGCFGTGWPSWAGRLRSHSLLPRAIAPMTR